MRIQALCKLKSELITQHGMAYNFISIVVNKHITKVKQDLLQSINIFEKSYYPDRIDTQF